MKNALLTFSCLLVMATDSGDLGHSSGASAQENRSIEQIHAACAEVEKEAKFLTGSNDYKAVFRAVHRPNPG